MISVSINMSSLNFQERFKDKISKISKQGEIDMSKAQPINIVPKTALQISANLMIKPSQGLLMPLSAPGSKSTSVVEQSYVPYTLKDYKQIKHSKYYELGGLGAVNIGSDDWNHKRNALLKRNEYARKAQISYLSRPPLKVNRNLPPVVSKRDRALEYAKKVPKPWIQSENILGKSDWNANSYVKLPEKSQYA